MKKSIVILQCVTIFFLCGTWAILEVSISYWIGQSFFSLLSFLLGTAGICLLMRGKPSQGKKIFSVLVSVVKNLTALFFQFFNLWNMSFAYYPVRTTFIVAAFAMLGFTFLAEIIYIALWKEERKS
jgi:hypothetical protein